MSARLYRKARDQLLVVVFQSVSGLLGPATRIEPGRSYNMTAETAIRVAIMIRASVIKTASNWFAMILLALLVGVSGAFADGLNGFSLDLNSSSENPGPPSGGSQGNRPAAATPAIQCDRLAGRPGDKDLPVGISGVEFDKIRPDEAEAACHAALKSDPHSARISFQLARALDAAKKYGQASDQYRRASVLGHAGAMNNLGTLYEEGQGVSRDYGEALRWYRKAADLGHVGAMANLGLAYRRGRGVSKDEASARFWFKKAAALGSTEARRHLAASNLLSLSQLECTKWLARSPNFCRVFTATNLECQHAYSFIDGLMLDAFVALKCFRRCTRSECSYSSAELIGNGDEGSIFKGVMNGDVAGSMNEVRATLTDGRRLRCSIQYRRWRDGTTTSYSCSLAH